MFSTLLIVLPIFALILAGYACRKSGALGPNAAGELTRFVIYLALPALLFQVTAKATWAEIDQPGFLAAFSLGSAITFVLTVLVSLRMPRQLADASIDGLNAAYANTAFIGFPLCLAALGPASLAPVTLATILTVCVLFGVAVVMIEVGLQTEARFHHALGKVGLRLCRNPLLVAPVLGAVAAIAGIGLPAAAEPFFKLLGGAASPCALVSLGLFLAEKRERFAIRPVVFLTFLKLGLQPVLTWFFAYRVFHMPPLWAQAAVLIAMLPTGTGAFMLAEFYRREAVTTSGAILVSTVTSVVTVTVYLALAGISPH